MRLPLGVFSLLIGPGGRAGPQGPGLGSALLVSDFYFTSSLWLRADNGFGGAFGGMWAPVFSEYLLVSERRCPEPLEGESSCGNYEQSPQSSSTALLSLLATHLLLCDGDRDSPGTAWHLSVSICWWP